MSEFLRSHFARLIEQPVERLLKPGIKAVVVIATLSTAAHVLSAGSLDKQGLARMAGTAPKPTSTARR